ncbi:MAG: hypothetical protein NT154_36375, partial [Verrucomicrobia bacterium]|nr:hypothetical protein [Verrucomicrobiota bacterium]
MNELVSPNAALKAQSEYWVQHEFYRTAVVLGIDIGLEGIGLYLRRGPNEIFARSVMMELPQAEALADRRQKRGWRHCRKNRKRRLHRLKMLFAMHGLPWLDAERMSRSLPFRERHRAVNKGVASKEALSICIRHCVEHRGYDYGGTEEGAFPWGDSPLLSKAAAWLSTAYVTPDLADKLQDIEPQLQAGRKEEEQREHFLYLLRDRLAWSAENDIARVLAEHSQGGHDNLRTRARGHNFPRSKVWEHLEGIIRRHEHLISDAEGFVAALGLDPNREPDAKRAAKAKRRAIFFYNRKTRLEMERHWAKKVNICPFAAKLGLDHPEERCAENGDLNIRRWKLLEFAATRRLEIDVAEGRGAAKRRRSLLHRLSAAAIGKLLESVQKHHAAVVARHRDAEPKWDESKNIVLEDITAAWGERAKPIPETKSDWNKSYFSQLKDLLVPTLSNRTQRAALSAASAVRLFDLASAEGMSFTPEEITERLRKAGFYDWRRDASVDFNPYPQVEVLLGRRIKRGTKRGHLSETCQGLLRRIFAEHEDQLEGKTAPDYCVIEVIGDPPRNALQRAERDQEMKERREKRNKLFEHHNLDDSGVASRRRRVTLWEQQKGKCPFTGKELPANPLDPSLELEHIFPEDMGGLSVEENLALTWRTVNADKGKRTPLQFAAKLGVPFDQLMAHTQEMRWSAKKREIFAWGAIKEDRGDRASHYNPDGSLCIPDFGNTTRMAQLARQLRAEVMRWMKVEGDPDEATRRIGTPSGWLAAQARKSWLAQGDYEKVRNNLTHHLIDAAVLAHIPPREGMNSVFYKGIFYVVREPVRNEITGTTSHRLLTRALPQLSPLPRLNHWLPVNGEYAVCPVLKPRRQSKTQSLGDATFWRQVSPEEGTLAQRTVLNPEKITDADELHATLQRMRVDWNKKKQQAENKIPNRDALQAWLDAATPATRADKDKPVPPLKLTDGTPIKNLWKFDSKGSLSSPVGWSGKRNADGRLRELRSISLKYDRLELWLGYDHQKAERARKAKTPDWEQAGWVYQKRLIPDARALRHLKQMGFSFGRDQRRKAPAFMQAKPDQPETHLTVRDLVLGGRLLPFSCKVGAIKKGDEFLLHLLPDGSIRKRTPSDQPEPSAADSTFYAVTALSHEGGNPRVELKSRLFNEKQGTPL